MNIITVQINMIDVEKLKTDFSVSNFQRIPPFLL